MMNMQEIEYKIKEMAKKNDIEALNSVYKNLLSVGHRHPFETIQCIRKLIDIELELGDFKDA